MNKASFILNYLLKKNVFSQSFILWESAHIMRIDTLWRTDTVPIEREKKKPNLPYGYVDKLCQGFIMEKWRSMLSCIVWGKEELSQCHVHK